MLIDACNLTVWPLALDSRLQADAGTETLYIKAKDRMTMDRWLEAFNPPREDEDIYQAWECPQFVVLKDWYGSFGIVCRRTPFPIFSGLLPTLFSAVWRRRERERGGGPAAQRHRRWASESCLSPITAVCECHEGVVHNNDAPLLAWLRGGPPLEG